MQEISETRKKLEVSVDRHAQNCNVCKSEHKAELEKLYLRFEPVKELANEFGLSLDAVYRHIRYYELSRKRAADTEKVLEAIIQKGVETLANLPLVDPKLVIESVKELHKIRGLRQQDRPNESVHDSETAQRLSEVLGKGKERKLKLVNE